MKVKNSGRRSVINMTAAMLVFGTIGIFVRGISLPSSVIAFVRGIIGAIFLIIYAVLKKERISMRNIKRHLPMLAFSGGAIGINWILFFEAYRYTTVAAATLCYYFAPIFVMLFAPVVFKERLTVKKILCIAGALVGMVLVSGVLKTNIVVSDLKGMALGLGAAVFYAFVIICNKKLCDISAYEKTISQLAAASLVLLLYVIITENISTLSVDLTGIVLLITIGIIHTGVAYALYFGAVGELPAQTTAVFSYIDPVTAVILSAAVLREPMDIYMLLGAVLILGAAWVSELSIKKR